MRNELEVNEHVENHCGDGCVIHIKIVARHLTAPFDGIKFRFIRFDPTCLHGLFVGSHEHQVKLKMDENTLVMVEKINYIKLN